MTIFNPYEPHAVAFDIDGIFLDTATEMWSAFMKHYNLDWPISRWNTYFAEDVLGKTKQEITAIYEPVLAREDIPPLKGAPSVVDWFYQESGYPVLFVTARRKQFCAAAEESISKALNKKTKFKILCLDQLAVKDRNDKLQTLVDNNVKLFFEDNSTYWRDYMDRNIHVGTFSLPWTEQDIVNVKGEGYKLQVYKDWDEVEKSLKKVVNFYYMYGAVKKHYAE